EPACLGQADGKFIQSLFQPANPMFRLFNTTFSGCPVGHEEKYRPNAGSRLGFLRSWMRRAINVSCHSSTSRFEAPAKDQGRRATRGQPSSQTIVEICNWDWPVRPS